MQNVTLACFGLSYLVALLCEAVRLRWPRRGLRTAGLLFAFAGLVAHTWYLALHAPSPAVPAGALLALAWVLAVFSFYGTLHHARQAWAVFGLPPVLILVTLAAAFPDPNATTLPWTSAAHFWGTLHGVFLLLASVGIGVGAIASAMYLAQAARLRRKLQPAGRLRMLSLERLEGMNRRAINASFPLLTLGLLIGLFLVKSEAATAGNWLSLKVLGAFGLWLAVPLLMYLRYGVHVSGRRMAVLTLVTFALVVVVLLANHSFARAGEASP